MKLFNKIYFILIAISIQAISNTILAAQTPSWITAAENQSSTNTWLCFRKEISLQNSPTKAVARIAVDSKYWLWINGKMVVFEGGIKRGPNPRDTYYDKLDISQYLKKGENTIAVLLWYFGKEGFSYNPSGKAALFFDCTIDETIHLYSDSSWKARKHPSYFTPGNPYPNYRLPESNIGFDARNNIGDWWETCYDEKWKKAIECGKEGDSPWNKLHDRIIPLWKNYGLKKYINTYRKSGVTKDTIVAILPYNCQITPYMKINSEMEGERITIYTDHYRGGGSYNVRGEYITKKGVQDYESLGWMNGQEVYYILPKDINLIEVKYRETSYNTEYSGIFRCDDDFLNTYFEKAKRTLLVTMRDTYMDCPDRERAQWWGDLVIESGESFYALDTQSHLLTKKGMYELIGWQKENGVIHSPIPASNYEAELPGQMLASIGYYGFWNYYMNTEDLKTIKDLYNGVKKYLKIWSFKDGLIEVRKTAWLWGDWGTNIDKKGLINLWYYLALKGARNMANALGIEKDAAEYQSMMNIMKDTINSKFWNGICYQHPSFKGNIDERVSALAVVSGIVDKSRYPSLLKIFENVEYASPYMEKYVMEACFIMGNGELGLKRMKKRFHDMVTNNNHSTLFEGWGIGKNGFGGGSTNHAWSGGGLTVFAQYVMGVKPLTAGYETVSVSPSPSGIKHAKMEMATTRGQMYFCYNDNDNYFNMDISLPSTVKIEVKIKHQPYEKIYWDNKSIDKSKDKSISTNDSFFIDGDYIIIHSNLGGKHKLTCKKAL